MIAPQQRARLFDLVLRFNRRLEHITRRLEPELLINENHLLSELRTHPAITAHDLSRSLQMEKSMLSRMLASIESRGLLEASISTHDRRRKFLSLTPKGILTLENDNKVRDQQVIECIAALDRSEQDELRVLLGLLADGMNAAELVGAEWENPIKIQIRRLTRSLGMLGSNYLGCEMSVENCQILHLILQATRDSSESTRMSEIRRILPYEFSILSRMISQLQKDGLVQKQPGVSDRRQVHLSLSSSGRARSEFNIDRGGKTLAIGLRDFSSTQIERLCDLIDKFVSDDIEIVSGSGSQLVGEQGELRREARAFVVAQLVERGLEREVPEMLLAASSDVVIHLDNGRINAVLEFAKSSGIKLALAKDQSDLKSMLALLFDERRMRILKWDYSSKLNASLNQLCEPDQLGCITAKQFRKR